MEPEQVCDRVREVLSAGLDGEAAPQEQAGADAHLATCADCRRWLDGAATVTRLARASLVTGGSADITGAVLAAAPGPGRARLAMVLRGLLLALGVAQLVLATVQVTALTADGHVHEAAARGGAAPGHLWHESAAWNAAVGVAFMWIALRRSRPTGVVAILSAFLVALLLLSGGDLVTGRVEASRLASHGFVVAGYAVVLALSIPRLGLLGPPGHRAGTSPQRSADTGHGEASLSPVIPMPHRVRAAWHERRRDAA